MSFFKPFWRAKSFSTNFLGGSYVGSWSVLNQYNGQCQCTGQYLYTFMQEVRHTDQHLARGWVAIDTLGELTPFRNHLAPPLKVLVWIIVVYMYLI